MTKEQWALFMFISLSQQAEAWSYALKGTMNAKSAHFLKKYMRGANEFTKHISEYYDLDELHEQSVVWTQIMEYIRSKPHSDQERMYWGIREFFETLESNHEAWNQCPKCLTNYDLREHENCPKCTTDELS